MVGNRSQVRKVVYDGSVRVSRNPQKYTEVIDRNAMGAHNEWELAGYDTAIDPMIDWALVGMTYLLARLQLAPQWKTGSVSGSRLQLRSRPEARQRKDKGCAIVGIIIRDRAKGYQEGKRRVTG